MEEWTMWFTQYWLTNDAQLTDIEMMNLNNISGKQLKELTQEKL